MVSWMTPQCHHACFRVSPRGAGSTLQLSPILLAVARCYLCRLLAMPQQRLLLLWDRRNWRYS